MISEKLKAERQLLVLITKEQLIIEQESYSIKPIVSEKLKAKRRLQSLTEAKEN